MAIGIGNLGNIVSDFTESVTQIFGGSNNPGKGGADLFKPEYGGSINVSDKDLSKWTGNARTQQVRYGFTTLTLDQVKSNSTGSKSSVYYLDIPPQAIRQKEVFATNITATRKGIIVESEGVVFKDIVIQGTTGVFPGKRGGFNGPTSNLFTSPFDAPGAPAGVDPKTGRSKASNVKTVSGYEEFLKLRQFFLKYAYEKTKADGNLFLVFINEKDNQSLIVEPLEFEMERNSKSPMTYQYKIVLKAIGSLNALFEGVSPTGKAGGFLGILEDIGNLSANISASVGQAQAVINASVTLLTRFTQAIDQTFLNPLRQVSLAMKSLADGISTVLSLPEVLVRNATSATLSIAESAQEIGNSVSNFSVSTTSDQTKRLKQTSEFQQQQAVLTRMQNDSQVPLPRSFVEKTIRSTQNLSNDLADSTNLGDPLFDTLKGRISTVQASPLKIVSDKEFILLGALQQTVSDLTMTLASNAMFAADAEITFERASALFFNESLPADQQIQIPRPDSVKEIVIRRNDTLERIAQREYGDALRWLDLVVINNLKPPYISDVKADGVKAYGEKLLIGNR